MRVPSGAQEHCKGIPAPSQGRSWRKSRWRSRGDEDACAIEPSFVRATEEDWGREYLDYILSLKLVDSVDEAIRHINTYNTGHSENNRDL